MKQTRKSTAFYVEALVLTFVLLGVITVLVQVFATARGQSRLAREKTDAAFIAQTLCAEFAALETPDAASLAVLMQGELDAAGNVTVFYSANGSPNKNGEYRCSLFINTAPTAAGQLAVLHLEITPRSATGGTPLTSFSTTRYFAAA